MGRKLRHVLIFLLIILKEPNMPEATCRSKCNPSSCNCARMGFNRIPQDLPTTILELNSIVSVLIGAIGFRIWYKRRAGNRHSGKNAKNVCNDRSPQAKTHLAALQHFTPPESQQGRNTITYDTTTVVASDHQYENSEEHNPSDHDHQYENSDQHNQRGPGQTQANTDTKVTVVTSVHGHQNENSDQHNQRGPGQTQANTDTNVTVVTSVHGHQNENSDQHNQRGPGQTQANTDTKVTVVTSVHGHRNENSDQHNQRGAGQSQANTDTNVTVVAIVHVHQNENCDQHNQAGPGLSQAIPGTNTNTTATVVTSAHGHQYENVDTQHEQAQSQPTNDHNESLGTGTSMIYIAEVAVSAPEPVYTCENDQRETNQTTEQNESIYTTEAAAAQSNTMYTI
ncbi:hypothetical protein Bbelb_149120 [Branchiostoma belcheri]|nr:hypothetical protein Bbelb_149120 [Branchiostoma belcheri]